MVEIFQSLTWEKLDGNIYSASRGLTDNRCLVHW
jgi:hypothetical protein